MARSATGDCPKFSFTPDLDDLGAFEELCSCNWRPGLVHRPGETAKPELCTSTNQAWSTPLAGWFDALPSGASRPTPPVNFDGGAPSSTPRRQTPQTNHNGKSARASQRTPAKSSTKSAGSRGHTPREAPKHGTRRFEHRLEVSEYIKDYREKNVLRLVGSDGCQVKDGNSAFGKTLPDPYAFKSDNFRKMYSRLQDFMKRRPKHTLAISAPFAVQEHRLPTPPSETANEKTRPEFSFSDEVQTNFSGVFSPAFQRPKDLVFRPFICGSGSRLGNGGGPAKLRYSHSAKRTEGSLPNIARDGVRFPMPAYVVTDSGNFYQEDRLGTPPKPGLASQMDLRLLEPKSTNGHRAKTVRGDSNIKPNIMSAEFDSAMIQFLQKAKQNLERVREQRIRKEALDRGKLVGRRGNKRSDPVVTPGKQTAVKPTTAVTDVRRIKLGVSQS